MQKQSVAEGILIVNVISASHISGAAKNSCFVRVTGSYNKQQFKTAVVKKNANPVWKEEFKFFTPACEGLLTLSLVRPGLVKSQELGYVVIPTASLSDGEPLEKEFEVTMGNKKKKKGETGLIKVRITFPLKSNETQAAPVSNKPRVLADCYTLGDEIGRGGFSIVRKGVNKTTNESVAIKIIDRSPSPDALLVLRREIDIMRRLSHKHIIALYDVFEETEKIYIVLELVTGGELFDQIVSRGVYTERDAALVISQILEAVAYMHDNGIAHRDLKPENLLCGGADGKQIKVSDFGLSKDCGQGLRTSCGTPDYVAPEVLKGLPYDNSVDIWSIGVITYILLCGFPPFYGSNDQQIFAKILKCSYDFPSPDWDEVTDSAKQFVSALLVADPTERPSAKECLLAPWITEQLPGRVLKTNVDKLNSYSTQRKKETHTL